MPLLLKIFWGFVIQFALKPNKIMGGWCDQAAANASMGKAPGQSPRRPGKAKSGTSPGKPLGEWGGKGWDGTYEHEGGDMFPWEYLDPDLMGYLEYLDPDLMGYLEIEEELKKLGYGEIRKMAYLMPDEDGDIHIYVEAKKGIISEGENNPIVDNANVNLTPKSKLNDEDACSQNIEVVGENHSVNLGLQNDPSKEDDVNEDSGDSTDEDYEAFLTRLQAIDDEYDDEAFEDYITDNSEYYIVRKGKKNDEQPLWRGLYSCFA
ncbi:hypothetical protein GH714_000344 [Hevea brasiliensis]|uniref:Uncharacterized protein n=1 Tax=Hevea brasiliensis TaxID=3981 RepID=A0A6A6KTS3_HEVBR|nr:hypothetical protein GH714_000344 [Hevea brasiliensis]